jgi:hypothetical protein
MQNIVYTVNQPIVLLIAFKCVVKVLLRFLP